MLELAEFLQDPWMFSYVFLGLLALFFLLALLLVRQSLRLTRLERKYRRLLGSAPEGNVEEILQSLHAELASVKEALSRTEKTQQSLFARMKTALRGVSLVRYNAFQNTGSDLSYSLALLDEGRDGVVLSAIYGREESRTYAKPVKGGRSSYHLSDEESRVLRQAEESLGSTVEGGSHG